MTRLLPGLRWLESYNRGVFRSDLFSGITIAAMLIPQSMGYALVAGLPVEFGLYACIIPPIIYALLGTSNKISMGPVALDSILILTGLSVLAEPGSQDYLSLAVTLTLMVGLLQAGFGFIKFGFIANFLSYPVILGYTCAASVIIIFSQVHSLLGVNGQGGNPFSQLMHFVAMAGSWHWLTVGMAALGLLFMVFPRRWFPGLPCGLILLIVGMAGAGWLGLAERGVEVIDSIPQGIPSPTIPDLSMAQVLQLIPVALTVALMGYVGSMSICKAQEKPTDRISANPDQELVAMGMANLAGALFRAFPVSASFSRSAAFVQAGALTQVSAVVSSLVITLILLYLTPLFSSYPLPRVFLAVIIVVSVTGLFKYRDMKALYAQDWHEFLLMLVTFVTTLLLGVQQGLLVGVVLSVARVIYNTARPHMTELGAMPGGRLYRNVNRFEEVEVRADVLIFRFDAALYFANTDYLVKNLYRWMNQREAGALTAVIFVAEAVNSVDSSAIRALQKVIQNLEQQGIRLYITNAIGPVRDALFNSPLREFVSEESMFASIHDAIDYIDHGVTSGDGVALQTNRQVGD